MTTPRTRIEQLTPEQAELLPQVRDEWLGHGLSTEPANRAAAEEGVRKAYIAGGLTPPRFMIWLDSPLAGAYGQAVAPAIVAAALSQQQPKEPAQVRAQVRDQVWAQVRAQVRDQVGDQVGDQVRAQVRDQVRAQVRAQVRDQVRAQVRAQVRDQVGDQVRDQVGDQVRDQVRAQVRAQVRDQVRAQVRAQVRDQVGDQVRDQVGDQVRDQVRAQVRAQVRDRLNSWTYGVIDPWYSYAYSAWFDACTRIGVTGLDAWEGHAQVAKNAGWWWAYRDFAILTERPVQIHRDAQTRLHSETGPAIAYRDGFALHVWHGTRVPADLIETGWDTARVFSERNTEIRRCAIERIGWDKFITESGMRLIGEAPDPGNDPHTISLYDLPDKLSGLYTEPARILLCTNGSVERDGTRRRFGLPVPAHHKDPVAAAADLYGWPVEAYRRLEVRR